MHRQLAMVAAAILGLTQLAGCDSAGLETMLGKGWGDLGDEVTAGPYKFQPPKKFEFDKKMTTSPGETKFMYRGPRFGKSEPGIILAFGAHNQDFSGQAPNWSSAVQLGLAGLRVKCTGFEQQVGSPTAVNGIPAVRVQFNGDFSLKGETRPMRGLGYLMIDDTYLLFALAMDFGPNAEANVGKMEKSLQTISRPGSTTPSFSWNGGAGASVASGSRLNSPGYPGRPPGSGPTSMGPTSMGPGSAGPGGMGMGSMGASGMGPGSTQPGSRGPGGMGMGSMGMGSGYPGANPGSGMSGYPGSMGPGRSGMAGGGPYGSGHPGSVPMGMGNSPMGSGYPGSRMGPGRGGYPGAGRPGYPGGMTPGGMAGSPRPGMSPGGVAGSPRPGMSSGSQPNIAKPVDPAEVQRRAELAKRKTEIVANAGDPGHAEYYQANVDLLRIGESSDRHQALNRIADAKPSDVSDAELRKEIARAVRDVAEDTGLESDVRRAAIPVLVTWGSTYSVPILIGLLQDTDRFVQIDGLDALAKLQDEQAIEPVTELFVKNPLVRKEAADCLRSFGTAAEDTVLELVSPTDYVITQTTVQLLGDIGTNKSVERLRLLRKLNFYKLVQQDVTDAIKKIRERESQEDES